MELDTFHMYLQPCEKCIIESIKSVLFYAEIGIVLWARNLCNISNDKSKFTVEKIWVDRHLY